MSCDILQITKLQLVDQKKDPFVVKFAESYKQEYGEEPDMQAALGYDAAIMLIDVIKRANSIEPGKIKEALAATKNLQGVSGIINLNASHDPVKSAVVVEYKEGIQVFKEKINP